MTVKILFEQWHDSEDGDESPVRVQAVGEIESPEGLACARGLLMGFFLPEIRPDRERREELRHALNSVDCVLRPRATRVSPSERARARAEARSRGSVLAYVWRARELIGDGDGWWTWRPAHVGLELVGGAARRCIPELATPGGERDGIVRDAVDALLCTGDAGSLELLLAAVRTDAAAATAAVDAAGAELAALPDEVLEGAGSWRTHPVATRVALACMASTDRPRRFELGVGCARRAILLRDEAAISELVDGGLLEIASAAGDAAPRSLADLLVRACDHHRSTSAARNRLRRACLEAGLGPLLSRHGFDPVPAARTMRERAGEFHGEAEATASLFRRAVDAALDPHSDAEQRSAGEALARAAALVSPDMCFEEARRCAPDGSAGRLAPWYASLARGFEPALLRSYLATDARAEAFLRRLHAEWDALRDDANVRDHLDRFVCGLYAWENAYRLVYRERRNALLAAFKVGFGVERVLRPDEINPERDFHFAVDRALGDPLHRSDPADPDGLERLVGRCPSLARRALDDAGGELEARWPDLAARLAAVAMDLAGAAERVRRLGPAHARALWGKDERRLVVELFRAAGGSEEDLAPAAGLVAGELERARAALAAREAEVASLRARAERAEAAAAEARADAGRARSDAAARKAELGGARDEISELSRRRAEAERELAALRARAQARPRRAAPPPPPPRLECAVCAVEGGRLVAAFPCGHAACCAACFGAIRARAPPGAPPPCPVCRAPVAEHRVVYVSSFR